MGFNALLDSYCPITLLKCGYKLLAKALATRLGPGLQHVVDPTQTAFVPGRWISDNVLCHLEEVEYLQQTVSLAAWCFWISARRMTA